ncbi:three-Cys-motif partner protein TcmP [Novosphingopyxis sp.]|uniref:three-Cys-motif partner protein TcmP n=1 Tax=Novosphingopyxis sp. TaxID=2709690 RepID=UPI003B5B66D2
MPDKGFYDGREQALVKHTFIERYLRDQLPKVSRFGTFTFVDLFAGPWKSRCESYSDTSFGIAMIQMRLAKQRQADLGHSVRMVAHLVEKENFAELEMAVAGIEDIEIHLYNGRAEDHASTIHRKIGADGFRFIVIDPKGIPDPTKFSELIAAPNSEVLINFMFQFANRFAHTEKMPPLGRWLSLVASNSDWQTDLGELTGQEREDRITDMAREALAKIGGYDFAPSITVDEADADRTLYKLIYLTRHALGLKVFRDAQSLALEVQSSMRSERKAKKRSQTSGMEDLFASEGVVVTGERSAKFLERGRRLGKQSALQTIQAAGSKGLTWKKVWTGVLDDWPITEKELAWECSKWKNDGLVQISDWGKSRRPNDAQIISMSDLTL